MRLAAEAANFKYSLREPAGRYQQVQAGAAEGVVGDGGGVGGVSGLSLGVYHLDIGRRAGSESDGGDVDDLAGLVGGGAGGDDGAFGAFHGFGGGADLAGGLASGLIALEFDVIQIGGAFGFLSGAQVATAGELKIADGVITLSAKSGHYQPEIESLKQVVDELTSRGVNMNNIVIDRSF